MTRKNERRERDVPCFVAFALFRDFRVSESSADKELYQQQIEARTGMLTRWCMSL